jgi:hypothetical protein
LVAWWRQTSLEFRKEYRGVAIVPGGHTLEAGVLISTVAATGIGLGLIVTDAFP